jgi:asparagine synthase (glutamine-hydrolysing)
MCGIAGILSRAGVTRERIEHMTMSLAHRGPDAQGTWVNDSATIGLGHTRLSIIDLSNGANQPFHSRDNRYVIAFNGEIYNFQVLRNELRDHHGVVFRTTSDTEVLVEAFAVWGKGVAARLEGMFAAVIADQQTGTVYLLRDRMGKKPLFYFQSGTTLAFASEMKALLRDPEIRNAVKINRDIFTTFLHLGYIPGPATIYENIFKFPAGHIGECDASLRMYARPYWQLQDHLSDVILTDPGHAKDTLRTLVHDAVAKRMISDVPLGAFLSGGTDSSLVTAVAAQQQSTPLKTFSIGFEESKFDESRYARAVARHLGTDHTAYTLSEKEALGILEQYLQHFDEPFADTSAIPTMLVSRLAREHVKVVLTGDGGDELFQGYGAYTWANRLAGPAMKLLRAPLRGMLQAVGTSRLERIAHLLASPLGSERSHIFSQEQYFFSQHELDTYAKGFTPFRYQDATDSKQRFTAGERQALFDLEYYLRDDLLVKVDRASMYYALECRSPLLDHHLIEFAFSLDASLKVRDGRTKWLLKELLREYIPAELVDRPKWGFSVPLATWLKGDLRYLIDRYLNSDAVAAAGIVDAAYVSRLVAGFFGGKDYLYNRLWVLIVLHKWLHDNG